MVALGAVPAAPPPDVDEQAATDNAAANAQTN
jgi:hypothetical protein